MWTRRAASVSDSTPASHLLSNSVIRSRVRNIRLIVLIASTLEAFVKIAGAATNVSAANGLWVNGVPSIRLLRLKLYSAFADNSWSRRGLDDHIVSAQRGRGGALQIRDRLIVIRFGADLGRARVDQLILKLKDQKSSREARPVPLLLSRQLNLRAFSRGPRRQNLFAGNLYGLRRVSHVDFNCLLQGPHLRQ